MTNKNYEFIEHTADISIIVKGKDLKDLFKNAASAMFEIIAERSKLDTKNRKTIKISQEADNLEELFINWLNELLSLSATKELIFSDFQITKLDKNNLEAAAIGSNISNYEIKTEIKAATYHELEIRQGYSGYEAKIIFDV